MELQEVLETTGTCRRYRSDPVPADVLRRILDAARFAPSGGNRQPLRFVVVRDPALRRALHDLYQPCWDAYVAPRRAAVERAGVALPAMLANADHFARRLHEVPVHLVVCFEVAAVLVTDAGLGRLPVVGGASLYPGVQNLLLKAREEGLGTALTTILCAEEAKVRTLLGIPAAFGMAALVAVGWPERPLPKRLQRRPLEEIAFGDRFGAPLV